MTQLTISDFIDSTNEFYIGSFYSAGKKFSDAPKWAMSLKAAQSMRFRYNEQNDNRKKFFEAFFCKMGKKREIVSVELCHSKTVFAVESSADIACRTGDGIITQNRALVPSVTAADCMPIFLFDPKTRVFGALHSGWRGTGIVSEALWLSAEKYGSRAENFLVVLAPHIQNCCYTVDEERAKYFCENFSADCVEKKDGKYHLSLQKANLFVLEKAGVKEENITVCTDCTCCAKNSAGKHPFGSFRRENGGINGKPFTVQAAFCYWG